MYTYINNYMKVIEPTQVLLSPSRKPHDAAGQRQ